MEVILSKDLKNVGLMGDVVKVKDGYARNYLLPQKLAHLATPVNLKRIEKEKQAKLEKFQAEKNVAENKAKELEKTSCTLSVEVNDQEQLYGSVSETDILKALETEGFSYTKKDLVIEAPIEALGIYEVGIKLHPEVTAKVRLWVTKK